MKIHELTLLMSALCATLASASAVGAQADSEAGAGSFRLSEMGPAGNENYDAESPSVAYNPIQDEYLVVWAGDDDAPIASGGRPEIYGQRIDATTGAEIGDDDFVISEPGPCCSGSHTSHWPAVVYNSTQHEYLVVWREGWSSGGGDGVYDIHGQRLDATTCAEVGTNDFRISDMTGQADQPAVAYDEVNNEYLVVWRGTNDTGHGAREWEIFGQRLDAAGQEIGDDDFRISDMGPDGDTALNAGFYAFFGDSVAVSHNPVDNEYLVVWFGADVSNSEWDVFGQRIDAMTGAEVGANDFPISDTDHPSGHSFAWYPTVAHNPVDNEYLVVWQEYLADLFAETSVLTQRLDASTGARIGANDLPIAEPGLGLSWLLPAVVYDTTSHEYLIVCSRGDGETNEILGQRLDASNGTAVSPCAFPISDMEVPTLSAAAAFNTTTGESLVVWMADLNTDAWFEEEYEIFGRLHLGGFNGWCDLGAALAGTHGTPLLMGTGTLTGGDPVTIDLTNALESTPAWLVVGFAELNAPFKGGVLVPDTSLPGLVLQMATGALGEITISTTWTPGLPSDFSTYFQFWTLDPGGPVGFAASNGLSATTP